MQLVAGAVLTLGAALAAQTAPQKIAVGRPTLVADQTMPRDYTPDGRNVSPPLTWSNLPAATKEIAVVCEDPDAGNPPPFVHWVIYKIPATAKGLPEGIPIDPAAPMPSAIAGAILRNERQPVRPEDADRRSTSHAERANRLDDLVDCRRALTHHALRQSALIEISDGITVVPDRIHSSRIRRRSVNYRQTLTALSAV